MIRIVSIAQMRALEKEADRKGITFDTMMENAGSAVSRECKKMVAGAADADIVVLCGSGNNGGDGLVAAARLAEEGLHVTAYILESRPKEEKRVRQAVEAGASVEWLNLASRDVALQKAIAHADVLLDALLGTGGKLPLRQDLSEILDLVQQCLTDRSLHLPILAIDCPSGIDCDSGEAPANAIAADRTVILGAMKQGLASFPAASFIGKAVVADIGLPDDLASWQNIQNFWVTGEWVGNLLPLRPRNSHKNTFGRAIVVGGSVNYPGAPILAGKGAYRSGAGLVTLAVPNSLYAAQASSLPEATWIVLPEETGVIASGAEDVLWPEANRAQAIVLGPGMGRDKTTQAFLQNFFIEATGQKAHIGFTHAVVEKEKTVENHRPPMVVDADALRMLANIESWWKHLPKGSILTPHPGEMAAITGKTNAEIQADRIGMARKYAQAWDVILVLKGAFTVVAHPDGRTAMEPFATSALAHAGTGDVLAGAIGGLLAQGMPSWEAAVLGAYLQGCAAELAMEVVGDEAGIMAGEVADWIPHGMHELRNP